MNNFNFYAPTYFAFGKEEDIETLAHVFSYGNNNNGKKRGGFVPLEQKQVEKIYRLML